MSGLIFGVEVEGGGGAQKRAKGEEKQTEREIARAFRARALVAIDGETIRFRLSPFEIAF